MLARNIRECRSVGRDPVTAPAGRFAVAKSIVKAAGSGSGRQSHIGRRGPAAQMAQAANRTVRGIRRGVSPRRGQSNYPWRWRVRREVVHSMAARCIKAGLGCQSAGKVGAVTDLAGRESCRLGAVWKRLGRSAV